MQGVQQGVQRESAQAEIGTNRLEIFLPILFLHVPEHVLFSMRLEASGCRAERLKHHLGAACSWLRRSCPKDFQGLRRGRVMYPTTIKPSAWRLHEIGRAHV